MRTKKFQKMQEEIRAVAAPYLNAGEKVVAGADARTGPLAVAMVAPKFMPRHFVVGTDHRLLDIPVSRWRRQPKGLRFADDLSDVTLVGGFASNRGNLPIRRRDGQLFKSWILDRKWIPETRAIAALLSNEKAHAAAA